MRPLCLLAILALTGCQTYENPLELPTGEAFESLQDDKTGYGGDAVVCGTRQTGYTVELFDFYEARILRGTAFAPASGDPYVVAQEVIDQVTARHPVLGAKLAASLEHFQQTARLIPVALKNVSDEGAVAFQADCQIARPPSGPRTRSLAIRSTSSTSASGRPWTCGTRPA